MKTTLVCSILTCCTAVLAATVPVFAENAQKNDSDRPARARPGGGGWEKVDKDGSGGISREEFAAMERLEKLAEEQRAALFNRLDKDGNGIIDKREIQQGRPPHDRKPPMPPIWELDKDSDGGVSFEEFKAGEFFSKLNAEKQQRIFTRLDSNQDGRITPEDRPERRPGGGEDRKGKRLNPRQMLRELDGNQDGGVSFEEFSANPRLQRMPEQMKREKFNALDRNADGQIDRRDFPKRDATTDGSRGEGRGPRPE